jgi:hypothetical protein
MTRSTSRMNLSVISQVTNTEHHSTAVTTSPYIYLVLVPFHIETRAYHAVMGHPACLVPRTDSSYLPS